MKVWWSIFIFYYLYNINLICYSFPSNGKFRNSLDNHNFIQRSFINSKKYYNINTVIILFYLKKILFELTMMFWGFFYIHLVYPADLFLHYWLPDKSLYNSDFVYVSALKWYWDQWLAFKYDQICDIWSYLRLYLRDSFAFCWKMVVTQIRLGLTMYQWRFQNIISVLFDNSLILSFQSTC